MATNKQIAANQQNAKKSTGAKSPAGKAVVATNSTKHGIFSARAIISGENLEDFQSLLDGLVESLKPVGTLESFYVERISHVIWRQGRLVKAESAYLELQRGKKRTENIHAVENALGYQFGLLTHDTLSNDFEYSDEDSKQLNWTMSILEQYRALNLTKLHSGDVEELKKSPELYEAYLLDDNLSNEAGDISDCKRITQWLDPFLDYVVSLRNQLQVKFACSAVIALVQAEKTCPYTNEQLIRYQIALDGELQRAVEALRRQQVFRLKTKLP